MTNPILPNGLGTIQSIFEVSTIQHYPLSTRAFLSDGRVYYYARNTSSTALDVGKLLVMPDHIPNHGNLATATGALVVGSKDVGAITLGATLATLNQYRDGYLGVTDAGGEGHLYKIKSHSAVGSGLVMSDLVLRDQVAVASDANTTVSLILNPYDSPNLSGINQQDVLAGVAPFTIPAGDTTAQFGWVQTWGPCLVWCDEAVAAGAIFGQCVVTGTSVIGAIEEDDTATTVSQEPIVGYNITALVDTEYQAIDLRIRP